MTAERDLHARREPAQIEVAGCMRNEEGGLREVHFASNKLQPLVGWPAFQDTNGSRVAREGTIGERIDNGNRDHVGLRDVLYSPPATRARGDHVWSYRCRD